MFEKFPILQEGLALLRQATRDGAPITLWSKGSPHVIETSLSLYLAQEEAFRIVVPPSEEARAFFEEQEKKKNPECLFSISSLKANILFQSLFKRRDQNGAEFLLPKSIYRAKRRVNNRYEVPKTQTIKVYFQDPKHETITQERKMCDVSVGGCAFWVDFYEDKLFPRELILDQFKFKIEDIEVNCRAKVMHVTAPKITQGPRKIKVGILFLDLAESTRHKLHLWCLGKIKDHYLKYLD